MFVFFLFCFNKKSAYDMRISDWSSDVCSSDLELQGEDGIERPVVAAALPVAVMVAMVALHRLHVPSGRRPVAVAVPDDDRPPVPAMPAVVFPLVLVVLVILVCVLAVVAVGPLAPPVPELGRA